MAPGDDLGFHRLGEFINGGNRGRGEADGSNQNQDHKSNHPFRLADPIDRSKPTTALNGIRTKKLSTRPAPQ